MGLAFNALLLSLCLSFALHASGLGSSAAWLALVGSTGDVTFCGSEALLGALCFDTDNAVGLFTIITGLLVVSGAGFIFSKATVAAKAAVALGLFTFVVFPATLLDTPGIPLLLKIFVSAVLLLTFLAGIANWALSPSGEL